MTRSNTPERAGRSRRAALWALICAVLAVGALAASLGTAAAVPLPPPLGPCSGPACPGTFPPPNNGDFAGRDDTVNVFAGGNFTVNGRAAEAEGKVVVLGDMTVAKAGGGGYNVGVAGVGSRVPPSNGTDYLTVGGKLTVDPGSTLLVGGTDSKGAAWGNVRHGGAVTGTVDIDPPGRLIPDPDAATPYLGVRTQLGTLTSCYATQKATGTVVDQFGTVTFKGDGTSMLQVFNVTQPIGTPTSPIGLDFTGIPAGATVLVNLLGPSAYINTYTGGGPTDTTNALGPKLLWNAPTATSVTIAGSAQFQGSVMVGNPASTTRVTVPGVNGRTYVAGNLIHAGTAGTEFHAYPFNGDMPDCGHTATATPTSAPTTTAMGPTPTPTGPTSAPYTMTARATATGTATTVTATATATVTNAIASTTTTASAATTTAGSGPSNTPAPSTSGGGHHLPTTGVDGDELLFFAAVLLGALAVGLGLKQVTRRGPGRHH